MKKFSDFALDVNVLDGDKIRIDDVLNQEIEVIGLRMERRCWNNALLETRCCRFIGNKK